MARYVVDIRIPCKDRETYRRFKMFLVKMGFKNAEDGLNYLLSLFDLYREVPVKVYERPSRKS